MRRLAAAVRDGARHVISIAPRRWWPITTVFGFLAVVMLTLDSPQSHIADNRFEQVANPARRSAKWFSVWDWSRGLGDVREDVWPLTTLPAALYRSLGLSPALSLRLWHATCLVIAATGTVALLRLFRSRIGLEHLLAGLAVAFSSFSATFLIPSNLYAMFAVGPWLLVAFIRGINEHRGWRWAAVFALLIAAAGNPDIPGLVYALVPIVPAALYFIYSERTTSWGRVIRWTLAASALTMATSALTVMKTSMASRRFAGRVAETEPAAISAITSSWSESVRGVGNWLSYFRLDGRLLKPQGLVYFDHPVVVIATFVVPVAALLFVWRSDWRPRLLFASLMVISLVLVVGGYGAPDSPLGRAMLRAFEGSGPLAGFRNTYKAAGGLVVGGAVLAAMGVVAAHQALRSRSRVLGTLPIFGAVATLAAVSVPFWSGQIYHPDNRFDAVPQYWSDAFEYLDDIEEPGRVLIVPATSRAAYRWGWIGDDIFDALLTRSHAVATGVPLSAPLGADAVEALTMASQDPHHRPGELAASAARLGITEIVVRNDLDWRRSQLARPALFRGLRNDPDFELVATFGDRGTNVVGPLDQSADAAYERTLPPVEIYRLRSSTGQVRTLRADATTIVSGDAGSWTTMEGFGLLDEGPVVPSGASSTDQIGDALERGAEVVITDTARRRARALLAFEPDVSHTVAAGQDLDRPGRSLYDRAGASSVAWYRDATMITGTFTRGGWTSRRPAMAFDRDPQTAWTLRRPGLGSEPRLGVRFPGPRNIGFVDIDALAGARGSPTVLRARVELSDGTALVAIVDDEGRGRVDVGGRPTSSIDIVVEVFDLFETDIGISEVRIDDLDLREYVQTPDDLFRRPELAARLREVPTSYVFSRVTTPTWFVRPARSAVEFDEERRIDRRFRTNAPRRFDLLGSASTSALTSDEIVDRLMGGDYGAHGSSRVVTNRSGGWGVLAVDGDPDTAWLGAARIGETLNVRMPEQALRSVRLLSSDEPDAQPIEAVEIRVGDAATVVSRVRRTCDGEDRCTFETTARFPPGTRADRFEIVVDSLDPDAQGTHVRIDEVIVNGRANDPLDRRSLLGGDCADVGLAVRDRGRAATPVLVRASGNVGALLAGTRVDVEGCDEISLGEGWHLLEGGDPAFFDRLALTATERSVGLPQAGSSAAIEAWRPDRLEASTELERPSIVTLTTSFDAGWKLVTPSGSFVPSTPFDAVNGWYVPAGEELTLEFVRPGDRLIRLAAAISMLGVLVCLALIAGAARRPGAHRRPVVDPRPPRAVSPGRPGGGSTNTAAVVVGTLIGVVVVGPIAVVVGAGALVAGRVGAIRHFDLVAPVLIALAALTTVVEAPLGSSHVNMSFAASRPWSSGLVSIGVAFLIVSVAWASSASASRSGTSLTTHAAPAHGQPPPVRRSRPTLPSWLTTSIRTPLMPVVVVGAVAATLVDRWFGVGPRRPGDADLIDNLLLGTQYTLSPLTGPPAVEVPPAGPLAAAFLPGGPSLLSAIVAALTVASVALVAARFTPARPRMAGAGAVVAALLLPVVWETSWATRLAGLAVVAAVGVADPRSLTPSRAWMTGVLLGVAFLARPDSVIAFVVLLVWWVMWKRSRHMVRCTTGFALVSAAWLTFVWTNSTSWSPVGSWSAVLREAPPGAHGATAWSTASAVLGLAVGIGMVMWRRHDFRRLFPFVLIPLASAVAGLAVLADRSLIAWAAPTLAVLIGATVPWRHRASSSSRSNHSFASATSEA
jgi:arabinofuranan 3-O-arabinosyltransferase